ncbi:sodium channel regulatory subunit beta-2-like [Anableps anableps]
MDSVPATSLFWAQMFIIFISSVSADQTNITAEAGHNASLPCTSPNSKPVLVLEWIRPDLGSEYVFLYRNRQIDLENQHVMFKNRVDLQDRQMKDGDVSLVLRNVTTDDRGTYECRLVQTERNSRRKTTVIINLDILLPPGEPDEGNNDGPAGLIAGLLVGLLALVIVAAVVCYFTRKKPSCLNQKSNQPPEGPHETQQPLTDQNQPAEQ